MLTTEGRSSLLTMLADTEDENPLVWRSLPGFYWHAPVIKAKAGTEVLAVHANRNNRFGRIPLIVTSSAGNGKVLFMGIDSAWRWRRGVEDNYHYRFWGQVARWMSYQRNMAAGQRVRLYFSPERPVPGDTVTLNANAFDPNGAPLQEGTVTVDLIAPDGIFRQIELDKNDTSWGAFSGRFRIDQPGEWKLTARVGRRPRRHGRNHPPRPGHPTRENRPAGPPRRARGNDPHRPRPHRPARPASPNWSARSAPSPNPARSSPACPLWSHWITVAAIIALLTIFWAGRKLNGMF